MRLGKSEWDRWAASIIKVREDLTSTVNDRAVFQGFSDMVRENGDWIDAHQGRFFCQFVLRAYVARVALGIRRQVKRRDDSISLVRILSQMKECAPQLTFDFYLERFPRGPVPWQNATFKKVSEDGRVASEAIIAKDIEAVERLTKQVEAFADRQLAHLDRKGFTGTVTFNDLDRALDTLDRIACKYVCLLTGQYSDTLEATILFPWKEIFSFSFRQPR